MRDEPIVTTRGGPASPDPGGPVGPDFRLPPEQKHRAQLEALRRAFPDYTVGLITRGNRIRFEVVSRSGGSPYCLITDDASEIWRELRHGRS